MSEPVVYDCMIFLQAALRPERVHSTFKAVRAGAAKLFVSLEVLAEIRDVLSRPQLRANAPGLTSQSIDAFLADVLKHATLIRDVPDLYVLERDPKDSKYINLALAAKATHLVTWDNDLLGLMDYSRSDARLFRATFPDLKFVDPPAFLQRLADLRK